MERLEEGQPHDNRWHCLGQYTVYRGGILIDDRTDVSGKRIANGTPVVRGRINGERTDLTRNSAGV